MSIESLSSQDNKKLKYFFEEGKKQLQMIEDLQGSLKDMISALSEELDIKKNVLSKALKSSYKDSFSKEKESVDEIENILNIIGE